MFLFSKDSLDCFVALVLNRWFNGRHRNCWVIFPSQAIIDFSVTSSVAAESGLVPD